MDFSVRNGGVKKVTIEQKIDYMIQSLLLAKEEIIYAKEYLDEKSKDKEFYEYGHMGKCRKPNGTIIRESLKQVGRMANIVADNVTLSPYCIHLFRE